MAEFAPANSLSCVLLNDMYQLTMAYAYWKAGKQFVRHCVLSTPRFGAK